MKLFYILISFLFCIYLTSCAIPTKKITKQEEYTKYLNLENNETKKNLEIQLQFWNKKLDRDSTKIVALGAIAKLYTQLFQVTQTIEYIKKAEQVLDRTVAIAAIGKPNYLLALARNYITQHRFKAAKEVAEQAYEMSGKAEEAAMVLFDIYMELGAYTDAEHCLKRFSNPNDYNFLIRMAKWSDHQGNLTATLQHMEKAKRIAEASNQSELLLWSYTNIADYYGHHGDIKASYEHYLKALAIDPNNTYAKKGIAWIVYSYEQNSEEALRILESMTNSNPTLDQLLFKAEIAAYQKDTIAKKTYIEHYINKVKDPKYGVMYTTYNALLMAEELHSVQEALQIAKQEVDHRPTPETYGLLAYILHLNGEDQKALTIAEDHIVGKTFEPEIQYYVAQIYKANGKLDKVKHLKKELMDSAYELGPLTMRSIRSL